MIVFGQVVALIKCLKGHKSLGLLCGWQLGHVGNGKRPTDRQTLQPIDRLLVIRLNLLHICLIFIHYGRCKAGLLETANFGLVGDFGVLEC